MPDDPTVRLGVVEEQIRGLREDAGEIKTELGRTRDRLHTLEKTTASLVLEGRAKREADRSSQKRLEVRLQILTFVVGVVGIIVPLLTLAAHR